MVSTEIIIPPRSINVLGGKHPLTSAHQQVEVRAGATIAEALDEVIASTTIDWPADRFVATVNDVRVPREWWDRVRPKPGTVVIFRPLASGDNPMRTLLFLGVAIAALFIAPFIAGTVLGLTGAALAAGTSIIGGAITIGGALLLNALIPLRQPQLDTGQPKTLPMLAGSSNEARPWGSIPVVLGRHRLSPMYAAMPYSQFVGKDQYMHMLFCPGYGRLQITDPRIGDTPIDSFEEVTWEPDDGADMEKNVDLFPINANEQQLSITLKSGDSWITRTTGEKSKTISIDLIAANGIWIYNTKKGTYDDRPVVIGVQYRSVTTPGSAVGAGDWVAIPNVTFTRNRDAYRLGAQWDVATPGYYEVRVIKLTADYVGTGQVADTILWQTLRGVQTGVPIYFNKPLALIGLKARATDQFNGVINTFNVVVASYVRDCRSWNGTIFTNLNKLSSNPADLFLHVLIGPANARPRKMSQIHLQSIQDWATDCDARGYQYNGVVTDPRTVRDVLADIAAAGRATVALKDGRWGVSFPRDTDPVSWHFTPRNSSAMKSTHTYREFPHALRVRWINYAENWRQVEGLVFNDHPYDTGRYTLATATLFESVEFPGITDWANIVKAARYQMAQAFLRPETHTLNADIESLRLERGDKITLSNDILLIGTGYGRVTGVSGQTATIDSRVIMEPGKTYQAKFSLIDGTILTRTIYNSANETDELQFDSNDTDHRVPTVGNLFSFGETQKVTNDYRVLDVRPGADFSAQFTLVDDASNADYGQNTPIDNYDPGMSVPPDPYELAPKDLVFSESFSGFGITAKATVRLMVLIPRVGTIISFEYQWRDLDTDINPYNPQHPEKGLWLPFASVAAPLLYATKDNLEAGNYIFRVRSLYRPDIGQMAGGSSKWLYTNPPVVNVLSLLSPPPDLTGDIRATVLGDTMVLEWDPVSAINVAFYRVKYSQVTDGTATWGSSTTLSTTSTNRMTSATLKGTFFVKAVTYADIESLNPIWKIVVTSPAVQPNIVATLNEGAGFVGVDGVPIASASPLFPGTYNSTQVQSLLLTLAFQSGSLQYTLNQGFYQFFNWIDLGSVYTSRITAKVAASGISGDTMDHWVTLAGVLALDSTDPSQWSIEMVYMASNGPTNAKSIKQLITDAGLLTNLKLCLEAGTLASWPGSGQKWLDESGGGYDFFLGSTGTASPTDPAEPSFVGTAGGLVRTNYWSFDGGDYFTYDTTTEAWMNAIHQNNALATGLVVFYCAADGAVHFLMGDTSAVTDVGFQFYINNANKVNFLTTNGSIISYSVQSTAVITTTGWHVAAFSINEAAGTGTLLLDGVALAITPTYTSPSAAAATRAFSIGAAGGGGAALPAGNRVAAVAMWQGVALTAAQLTALSNTILHNDDFIWGAWTPFSVTDVTARALLFGIRLNGSPDGAISPAVSQLAVTVDMPDRHIGFDVKPPNTPNGSGTSPAGLTLNFVPPFRKLKSIALSNYTLDTTEKYSILSADENHVTIVFTGPGPTTINKTFSLHAYGYGAVVT